MVLLKLTGVISGAEVERMSEMGNGMRVIDVLETRFGCLATQFCIAHNAIWQRDRDNEFTNEYVVRVSLSGLSAN